MRLIDRDTAQVLLTTYHADLRECVETGWRSWSAHVRPTMPMPFPRVLANCVHQYAADEARRRFGQDPRVEIKEEMARFLLCIDKRALLRFKRLDDAMQTSNYPTPSAVLFDRQTVLPHVPLLSRLTVGYRLNQAETELASVHIVLAKGRRILWDYEIEKGSGAVVVPMQRSLTLTPATVRGRGEGKNNKASKDGE